MEKLYSIEDFDSHNECHEIKSPRSLEACLRVGIDPVELKLREKKTFKKKNVTPAMVHLMYDNYLSKREMKIKMVSDERKKIISYVKFKANLKNSYENDDAPVVHIGVAVDKTSAMLEMEEKRMEALKRRQEKDLAKTIEKEQMVVDIQMKIQRAEEEERKKQKVHLKKVMEQKKAEEKKRQQMALEEKRLEEEEAANKRALAKREAEIADKIAKNRLKMELQLAAEARARDEERKIKMAEYAAQTAALLKLQEDAAEENRLKMLEREQRIQIQLQEKKTKKAQEVAESRAKAEIRIAEALKKSEAIEAKKKADYDAKVQKAAILAKEKALIEKENLAKQVDAREKRNTMRLARLVNAYQNRRNHRESIVRRRKEKDSIMETLNKKTQERVETLKFMADLKLEDKVENVERIARINEFKRLQTKQRIEALDDKYNMIMNQRNGLKEKQRAQAKQNLIRKHEIADTMDRMRVTNDYSLLESLFDKKSNNGGKEHDEDEKDKFGQTM